MPDFNEPSTSAGDPLDALIADYLQQIEAGNVPDRESLLAAHPDLADRLRAFFADFDQLDRQAAELRLSADPNRTTDIPGPAGELPRVRYFGDYELLEVIARGGMGLVYKARQVSLNRLVALKMILRGELATERDVIRFRAEAEAAANLDHPHIVSVYEVGEHDGQQYYAMRYVEGTSLARRPRSDARSEARLLAAVAGAVHHAHRRGVLHRDLKPSNILVDAAGTPLVADFGLAKRVDADRSLTESGAIVGTPRYMAPEQAAGRKDLTVAADVYSLGVVLYERLTGRTPFEGQTVLEVLRQAREVEPPRPSSICPGLDRGLETICLKCLEKDPSKRYASAEALQEDLERWLRGEPIKARPVGPMERGWRWCRRNKAVASLLATVAGVLVVGTVVASWFAVRADKKAEEALQNQRELERQLLRSEWLVYAGQIAQAQHNWQDGNWREAWKALDNSRKDFRGWEYDYLYRRFTGNPCTFRGHTDYVFSVAFSPDGKRLVSGSLDKTVKIWNAQTGKEIRSLKGHTGSVRSVAFSPDGKRIVSASETVKVWDAESGQAVLSLNGRIGPVTSVAFSPDGKRLVSGGGNFNHGEVKVWDAQTGQEIRSLQGHSDRVTSVAFSPDGERLVTGGLGGALGMLGEVKVWDAQTGQEIRSLSLQGHTGPVWSVAFSPDGKRLASGSADKTVKVWDAQTGQEIFSLPGHSGPVSSVAFSPDGKRLVSGGASPGMGIAPIPGEVKVWDAQTGQETISFEHSKHFGFSVAFSPDSRRIACGGDHWDAGKRTHTGGEVTVWDVQTSRETLSLQGHAYAINTVAFSPDGKRLVSGGGDLKHGEVKVWDAQTGQEIRSLQGHTNAVDSVAFSPDGKHLLSFSVGYPGIQSMRRVGHAFPEAKVWDAQTGQLTLSLQGDNSLHLGSMAFNPDGRPLVIAGLINQNSGWNHRFEVRDAWSQEGRTLQGHFGWGNMVFSPDGKHLVGVAGQGSQPGEMKVWDAQTGQLTLPLQGRSDRVTSVAFSPDGKRLVTASPDKTVKVWDAQTGQEILSLQGHTGPVRSVAFSPDGKRIVSASEDKTVKVWDAESGQAVLSLNGHIAPVTSVAFSPDGKRIASGSNDKTVKIWDATRSAEDSP